MRRKLISRRRLLVRAVTATAGLALTEPPMRALAAAGRASSPPVHGNRISLAELVRQARRERELNVIALSRSWANYGEIVSTFERRYGLTVHEADPEGGSTDESEALRAAGAGRSAPDVVDVSLPFAVSGANDHLFARYYNTRFARVPNGMRDNRGYWVGDYWITIAFVVNTAAVTPPRSWAELAKPEYRDKVALAGSPPDSSAAVAAALGATLAAGGSLRDVGPGVSYFRQLRQAGNLVTTAPTPDGFATGATPVLIDWDFNGLRYADALAPAGVAVVVPAPAFGAYYCQALNARAPHPFAARLWQEFLYSDEGQLLWMRGGVHPALFADLVRRRVVPRELLARLPSLPPSAGVRFASPSLQQRASTQLAAEWPAKVGV